jgi:hypothetical protein
VVRVKSRTPSRSSSPRTAGAIKAAAVIGAVFAAGLVFVGFASLCTARTDPAVIPEAETSRPVASGSKIERSGIMIAHELLL